MARLSLRNRGKKDTAKSLMSLLLVNAARNLVATAKTVAASPLAADIAKQLVTAYADAATTTPVQKRKRLGRTRFVALRVVPSLVTIGVAVSAYLQREQLITAAAQAAAKARAQVPTIGQQGPGAQADYREQDLTASGAQQ